MSFSTVILSAGRSRRMGTAKAWLRLDGEWFLERIVRTALQAGSDRIYIVVGTDTSDENGSGALTTAEQIHARIPPEFLAQSEIVVGQPEGQAIDSLRPALLGFPQSHHLLLWPVDCPFPSAALVNALSANLSSSDMIALPSVHGKRGHPVLFGSRVWPELLLPLCDSGADKCVRKDLTRLIEVPMDDKRLITRLNTADDARALQVNVAHPVADMVGR